MATAVEPPPSDQLPGYALSLAAYHRAFAAELAGCVATLPVPAGGRALDLPCGDGFFSACLAERVGPRGEVVAADLSPAFLRLASRICRAAANVRLVEANAYRLPFPDRSFDLVWCAQSLISLSAPVKVLAEMRRVTRRGGTVAVLETDELHHVLLNWPTGVELAVQRATLAEATPTVWRGRPPVAQPVGGQRDAHRRAARRANADHHCRQAGPVRRADCRLLTSST